MREAGGSHCRPSPCADIGTHGDPTRASEDWFSNGEDCFSTGACFSRALDNCLTIRGSRRIGLP